MIAAESQLDLQKLLWRILPRRSAARVFAVTSQPMSERFGSSSDRITGDITH
jgi:hypothetical protein